MRSHRAWGPDPELLEPEAWDCPAWLSPHDCLEETGLEGRRNPARSDDPEDHR